MTKDQASAHIEATANELLTAVYHAINNTKLDIAWMKDVARRSTAALTAAAEVGNEFKPIYDSPNNRVRAAVAAERERCAQVVERYAVNIGDMAATIATELRALDK